MQAKQPNKEGLDQQFEDYAWSQMNVMLNRELPVQEEKKRRWLLILLLFLGIGVGGAMVYQVFQQEEQREIVKEERPIAERESEKRRNQQSAVNSERLDSANREEISNENLIAKNENYLSLTKPAISNQIEPNQATAHRPPPRLRSKQSTVNTISNNANKPIPNSESQITISESPTQNHQNLKSNSDLRMPDQQINTPIASGANQQLLPVPPMNMSPIPFLTSATRSITAEPTVHKFSKWELGARLGGIATLDKETHLSLGLDVAYHFKPKWSIRPGVSWISSKGNKLFSSSLEDAALTMDSFGNGRIPIEANGVNVDMAIQDSIISIISPQHHFLSIPLSLEYRISNRLSAYGGVQVLFPFSRKNDDSDSYQGQFVTAADPDLIDLKRGLFNADPIHSSWQWHTGIHFRATKHFSFDFSYHNILPKQGGRNHLEQYLELGVRYRIK